MIQLENIYKFYRTRGHRKVVLNHISVNFEPGYSYAILGMNGAGKSTMMRTLAGAELPNSGRVRRTARVSWPLGFSGGLHRMMTARENARFVARAYGEDINRVVDFVEDFAEIGPYFDVPLSTYSSGMVQRVAYGLSMAIDFDCYLIDETMAVGDGRFRDRCKEQFELRKNRSDLIMTSHSMMNIREYCQRGIVLAGGEVACFSRVDDAIEMYNRLNG
jgi:capsular polysaccharide transport system ATP-binding protein